MRQKIEELEKENTELKAKKIDIDALENIKIVTKLTEEMNRLKEVNAKLETENSEIKKQLAAYEEYYEKNNVSSNKRKKR